MRKNEKRRRSHHNAHSQQQNHHSHHQNSWFMSPNLVNNLFCSPTNSASTNFNNTFLTSSNINNHLTNLLNTPHHFISPNPNSSQSPLAGNNSFSSNYHGGHQNFSSQSYSSMFPPMSAHSSSVNMGSNGRLLVGQNNHHYQNQSNHSRAVHPNRMSRMNMNFNIEINQSGKYQSGFGLNDPILSLPNSNFYNKSTTDLCDKSSELVNHNRDSKKPNNNNNIINNMTAKQNQEKEMSKKTTKQLSLENNQSRKFMNKSQSVKGMENIKLDNEGVHSNYNPLAGVLSQNSKSSTSFNESLEQPIDKSYSSNNNSEKSPVKFTLTPNIDEEELIFTDNNIVEINKPSCDNGNKNRNKVVYENNSKASDSNKKIANETQSLNNLGKVETENGSESEKHNRFNNLSPQCSHSSIRQAACANVDFSNNEKNCMWTSQNQASLQNFNAHPQSSVVTQYPGSSAHYNVTPQNMSNYVSTAPQAASNFVMNCSNLNNPNTNNNLLAAAYLASSLGSSHPSVISTIAPKCNIYRQEDSFTSTYHDVSSSKLWQYYITNRQTEAVYVRKVQLRNALHMVMSYVFENAGLFIVGSSMNGFGNDNSDMDLCLTITSKELHQKKEAFVVLNQLVEPLRKCSFIKNLQLIRATVPILKFRDTLAGVDCDLNINNVVGIYNTHLLAMYNRIDWRLRPLGMYIKHWAQKVDLHDASRGRLSTYTLILMVIQYLQTGCKPPVLPCLQAVFPKQFSYDRQVKEVDMRLELPWEELRSSNTSKLSDLLMGFFEYYVEKFDFSRMAVSIRTGKPIPIEMAIKQLAPHEQLHNVKSFKLFVEEPFSLTNVSRSLFDVLVFARIKRGFRHSLQVMRLKQSLKLMFVLPNPISNSPSSATEHPEPCRSYSNQSLTTYNSNQDENSKTLPLSESNDNDTSEKSDLSCLEDNEEHLLSNKSDKISPDECDLEEVEELGAFDDN